ncbi:MAG: META domain-containing protein [Bacteroidota bacterium]
MLRTLLFIFSLSALWACKTKQLEQISLDGTEWQLKSMDDKAMESVVTLRFKEDEITGKSFCNQYFSSYKTDAKKLTISAVGATKRACPELDLERTYFEWLASAGAYAMNNKELMIDCEKGKLVFEQSAND